MEQRGSRESTWHLGYLDALRGIAVVAVVMVHACYWEYSPLPLHMHVVWIALTGQRGVALFFTVSAFTLFLSHDRRKQESRPTLFFFVRRLFRLAPMFYVATLVTALFLRPHLGPMKHVVLSLFFLHGLSANAIDHGAAGGWSVADEAIFYCTLPFLFAWIKNLRTAIVWLLVGLFGGEWLAEILAVDFPQHADFYRFYSFSAEFPVFLLGIVGFFAWKEMIRPEPMSASLRKQLSSLLLVFAAVLYWKLLPFTFHNLYESSFVGLLLLLALALHPWSLIVNPVTRFLGKISYSIYLLHFVFFLWIQYAVVSATAHHSLLAESYVRFVLCFFGTMVLTIPLSYVTWRWIEEPGIACGRKLIKLIGAKPVAEVGRRVSGNSAF